MIHLTKWFVALGLIGIISASIFIWQWNYSGSLIPLREQVVTPTGTFALAAPLPIIRTEAGGVVCYEQFYTLGGIDPWIRTLKSFMRYDPITNNWESLPNLPEQLNHPGVVTHQHNIYVVGGHGPIGLRPRGAMIARWDPQPSLFIFNTKTNTWSQGPNIPAPRGAGGATITPDAIWYVGGVGPDLNVEADLFRFDLTTQTWQTMKPMPTARDHLQLEAVDNHLYAISGRKDDLRHNLSVVERYDIKFNTWTRVADIPFARGGFGSTVYNGHIYTFGGEYVWTCLNNIERYNPKSNTWQTLDPLPEARHGIIAGVIKNRIHLISGGRHPRVSASGIHRTYIPSK